MRVPALRIQLYVLARVAAGVAVALSIIAAVVILIEMVEVSLTVGARVDLDFLTLLRLTLLSSPAVIVQLLPFAVLFGAMGAFWTLNRRSELIAMRAAGASAWRFSLPPAAAAAAFGALAMMGLNPGAARLAARFEVERAQLTGSAGGQEIWLRQADGRQRIVIHARGHELSGRAVRLENVSLFVEAGPQGGGRETVRRIRAKEAILDPGAWRLVDVAESLPGAETVATPSLTIASNLDRRTALEKFASPADIDFWRLPEAIGAAERAGYSSAPLVLRLHRLLAEPALFLAMILLAGAFSFRLARLGGLAALIVAGVASGFAIFFLDEFCGALASNEVVPAPLAAWATPILALLAGVSLLCYTEDG
ncbi:MAG: LptF/LptG family permease [Caulobacteraceae bacterium]